MNLIATPEELAKAVEYLEREVGIKDLRKIKYYLGIETEHTSNEIYPSNNLYRKGPEAV